MNFEIVIDKRENPRKCTVQPLKNRSDFNCIFWPRAKTEITLKSEILLHHEGELLGTCETRKVQSIAVIDCIWRKLDKIVNDIAKPLPKLVKIPPEFQTAYPRKNKTGGDPKGGLATIEAIFIAAAFCGSWDETILSKYHFAEEFLTKNQPIWQKYRLHHLL